MTHDELGKLLTLAERDAPATDRFQIEVSQHTRFSPTLASEWMAQPTLRGLLHALWVEHERLKRDWATTAHRQSEESARQVQTLKDQLSQSRAELSTLQDQNCALAKNLETYENRELAAQADDVKTLSGCVQAIAERIPHENAVHLAEAFRYLAHWSGRVIEREKEAEAERERERQDEDERRRYGYG